ncbi:MAG: excinuclease ABC subunit UvrC [Betaproteobacteria bacterium]|nr:excinuclease ABC subunit UvrC [Betaproteobacteria bacterium]
MEKQQDLSAPPASFDAAALIASLPQRPGVYRMFDREAALLYVGKAGNLKRRVSSYFQQRQLSPRIAHMMSKVHAVEFSITASETEALLLENNLIKQLKPRYNILFRDDKTYPYLRVTDDRFARIAYYRGSTQAKGHFFGPFPSAWAVKESLQILQKVFHLRTCDDSVFANRTRPCLEHQIGRCSAPCVGLIDELEYRADVQRALRFLRGDSKQVLEELEVLMLEHSARMAFEKAAVYRNRMAALAKVLQQQSMESEGDHDVDVIAFAYQGGRACLVLASVRGGTELLERFVLGYYESAPLPAVILASFSPSDSLKVWCDLQAGLSVQWLRSPQGIRRQWLQQAQTNADINLKQHLLQRSSAQERTEALIAMLATQSTSSSEDFRIECFDISHSAGEATQASCVVYKQHAMQPKLFRRYNIENITAGDDYAAMAQVLERRYASNPQSLPDLVLVDGGKGQVSVAAKLFASQGFPLNRIVGVAKGDGRKVGLETLLFADGRQALELAPDSAVLMLVAQIRDEAHRVAVSGMRAKRDKARQQSRLDEIEGIGPRRKQRLLTRFGGLRGVMAASIDELAQVEGVSKRLAESLYQQLRT